jgi:hypothetical protein
MQVTGANGKLDDHQFDTVYGELHMSGKVHKNVSWVLNFNANGQGATNADRFQQLPAGIEDAIVGLDLADEFHLWVGQLLTPVDRTNASGPFFTIPWTYTGVFVDPTSPTGGRFVGPNGEEIYGRSTGAVVWGDVGGQGKFKYFLSSMNMRAIDSRPLFSGRLVGTLIGSEKGFWGNSTWDGAQDVLAIGVGGQFQTDGSVGAANAVDDYKEFNADVVGEFGVGNGYITAEAGIYAFAGDYRSYDNMFYGLVAYASPPIGPGRLQPMFRYQTATGNTGVENLSKIEGQLGYLVKGAALRGLLGFSTTDYGGADNVNALQLGVQTIF